MVSFTPCLLNPQTKSLGSHRTGNRWAPELVWTWKREKSPLLVETETQAYSLQPVTIVTELE
jgi:hypothetical protein